MYISDHGIERRIKKRRKTIFLLIMVLLCAVAFIIIFKTDLLTVKRIEVSGNHIISKEEIIDYSGITIGNNLLKERVNQIQMSLSKNPYIKSATIRRKIPDKILIQVEERKEEGAIFFMDNFLIIDEEGMVLKSTPERRNLNLIKGLEFSDFMEGEVLNVKDVDQLKKALEIMRIIEEKEMIIAEIDVTDKNNIMIRLSQNLVCKIGSGKDLNYRIELLRMILMDLIAKDITRGVIDISHGGYPSYRPVE